MVYKSAPNWVIVSDGSHGRRQCIPQGGWKFVVRRLGYDSLHVGGECRSVTATFFIHSCIQVYMQRYFVKVYDRTGTSVDFLYFRMLFSISECCVMQCAMSVFVIVRSRHFMLRKLLVIFSRIFTYSCRVVAQCSRQVVCRYMQIR